MTARCICVCSDLGRPNLDAIERIEDEVAADGEKL